MTIEIVSFPIKHGGSFQFVMSTSLHNVSAVSAAIDSTRRCGALAPDAERNCPKIDPDAET